VLGRFSYASRHPKTFTKQSHPADCRRDPEADIQAARQIACVVRRDGMGSPENVCVSDDGGTRR
jgi:hypothetical protein